VRRRLGAPAGKMPVAAFSMCDQCAALPAVMSHVEDRIMADSAHELAKPEAN
jgi:hypothetical protein